MSTGSSSPGKTLDPKFFKTPFKYMRPEGRVIDSLSRQIGSAVGSDFGSRNLYGSGAMKDVFAEKLTQAAVGQTRLVPKGQWITPGQGQGSSEQAGLK